MKIKDIGDICGLDCPLFDGRLCGSNGGTCDRFDGEMEIDEAVKEMDMKEAARD